MFGKGVRTNWQHAPNYIQSEFTRHTQRGGQIWLLYRAPSFDMVAGDLPCEGALAATHGLTEEALDTIFGPSRLM